MHHLDYVLENEQQKLLFDFKIKTYNLISARQPNFMIVNKKENLLWCSG